jgi:hypothetical protein
MFKLSRLLIIYAIAAPLALLLGYMVVMTPGRTTFAFTGTLLLFFALPIFLKWHHLLLVLFWNSTLYFGFLPGTPDFWLFFALVSFFISALNHIMFQKSFLPAPELTRPLLFLGGVVLVTAEYRGGIGIRALGGGSYGGRYYVYIFAAIAGYFALTSETIPFRKAKKLSDWFFLSGISAALGNLVYTLGPFFYFLFVIIQPGVAVSQAQGEEGVTRIERISGLAPACIAMLCFLMAHFGIRGLFDIARPWRLLILFGTIGAAFFAGFRSIMVILFLLFAIQFYLEGLMRTHYLPIVLALGAFGCLPILLFSSSMPPSVQRAISFLPVNVDSDILQDAQGSAEWRFGMWSVMTKEIPKYLIMGRGYAINPEELMAVTQQARLGLQTEDYEASMLAGDYHSGPLSVIIPFGVFGSIGFIWLLIAGFRVLSWNRRYGDPRLRRINTTLLAYYITYCISFFFIFGALNTELPIFLGACGLSISLNGGVKRRAPVKAPPPPVAQAAMVMEAG